MKDQYRPVEEKASTVKSSFEAQSGLLAVAILAAPD